MESSKLRNVIFSSAVLLTAVAGTLGVPRLAANPTVLFVTAQVQMATGHTSDGLSLMNRLAQTAPGTVQPASKPSPAKQELNCRMKARPQALGTAPAKIIQRAEASREIPVQAHWAAIPTLQTVSQPRVPTQQEIDRQVRRIQERVNRSMLQQKFLKEASLQAALSSLQQRGAMVQLENASERVQSLQDITP
jgi:hypothetical protein